jgi:hypothetical protein
MCQLSFFFLGHKEDFALALRTALELRLNLVEPGN